MSSRKIEDFIIKYLCNEATTEDLDQLSKWILVEGNERIFDDYIKTHYEVITAMNKPPDIEKIKKNLLRDIQKDRRRTRILHIRNYFKYAAIFVLAFGVGYFYWQNIPESKPVNILTPKAEPVTITLDNGTTKIIKPEESIVLKDSKGNIIGKQDQTQLTYSKAVETEELIYNTLEVPYGKRFDVVLSDGTQVYLNAGTTLRYPINFLKGKKRNVFLSGEAYFEVAKDNDHPFVVSIGTMQIEVLGTAFNVSNYSEDSSMNTVLVEGSIILYQEKDKDTKGSSTLLEPGFKAEWDKKDGIVSIEHVDTKVYTAWVEGKLVFRNTPFLKIRQSLERKYNVKIQNANIDLDKQLYDATFDIETIEEVLESFNRSYAIKYRIANNEVIIE
ncbi:FecR family protein [Ulvibacterium sp.]|uniref:FecR family protein n=1 Tax=Ulvibacterium sp. TaxID=2665914 RepID=UPI003BADA1CB